MTRDQILKALKAALALLDQGNVDSARKLVASVVAGLELRKHK